MDVVVGLDSGTTATKAVTAGVDGQVRDVVQVAQSAQTPTELDARQVQRDCVAALTEIAACAARRGDPVVGVSLSAAMHGLVPLDADGVPQGPLLTWADTSAEGHAAQVRERAPGLHERTGTPVHAMSPLVKLARLSASDGEHVRRVPRWGGVKELQLAALCGRPDVVDASSASATGLRGDVAWDEEALGLAGVRASQLADVVTTTTALPLTADVPGLPRGLPVVVGASDGGMANVGTGAVRDGDIAVSLGTSGALRAVVRSRVHDARLFRYVLTEHRWIVGGAVSNAGSALKWAVSALGAADVAELLDEAGAVPAGSDGLLCLPYLLGERAPQWRDGVSGALLGLRQSHGRGHLARALVEGACQQLALVADALQDVGLPVHAVRATGGALEHPVWPATLASALAVPVHVCEPSAGTALGAALLGWHAVGGIADLDDVASLVQVAHVVEPQPDDAARYRALRPRVQRAADAVADVTRPVGQIGT
ncbi:MAG: gluconokinase [Actinomycetes bacterium]